MQTPQLGSIEKLPLRSIWPNEAHNFTRWMAEEENLALLGDAVGIDLELQETESAVGGFSADIYAKESGTGRKIIIENQLEDTDHDHLGKIITYAAGKDAQAVIWVVGRARDEHRKAVEWLNQHTDEDSAFFLVEVEVWRIGESLPAVRFNVVESPNEWAKAEKAKTGMTDTQKLQVEYWERYRQQAVAHSAFSARMKPQGARAQHWSTVHIGSSQYHLSLQTLISSGRVGVEIYFPNNKELGRIAFDHQGYLEEALGVRGKTFDASKACGIRFYKEGTYDIANRPDLWPELIGWQLDAAVKLYAAIKQIGL